MCDIERTFLIERLKLWVKAEDADVDSANAVDVLDFVLPDEPPAKKAMVDTSIFADIDAYTQRKETSAAGNIADIEKELMVSSLVFSICLSLHGNVILGLCA